MAAAGSDNEESGRIRAARWIWIGWISPFLCLAMVLLTAVLLTIIDADRTVAGPVLFAAIASSLLMMSLAAFARCPRCRELIYRKGVVWDGIVPPVKCPHCSLSFSLRSLHQGLRK